MNRAMSQRLSYREEEMTGVPVESIVHPADKASISEYIQTILSGAKELYKGVCRIREKTGKYIWCECISVNLLDEPDIEGIVTSWRDVTSYIDKETNLRAHNEELKNAYEQLDKFVYGVSHDMRAPLSSILGIINYTELEIADNEVKESLSLIKSSVHKLDKFIQDMLTCSKNSKTGLKVEKINFTELVGNVVNSLKHMHANTGDIEIRVAIACEIDFYSDKNRLDIILSNLISNALCYYNPKLLASYIEVQIKHLQDHISIIIKDNGMGISKANQEKIFDMFFRVSARSKGTGLGLYIVKETVEKLKGTIRVQSEPGESTCFEISIPNLIPGITDRQPVIEN